VTVEGGAVLEGGKPGRQARPGRADLLAAAVALHGYLAQAHIRDGALTGPDAGVRLNYRAGRLVKSYLRFLPWHEDYYYLQAQGYWILANWALFDRTGAPRYRDHALAASAGVVDRQTPDGAWPYPNPAWKGRIATAEGTWGCLGLVETARRTGDARTLDAVQRWRRFMENRIGLADLGGGAAAVHYFAGRDGSLVPNNSALAARLLAEVWALDSADRAARQQALRLLAFLADCQLGSGELPYAVPAPGAPGGGRVHFQCYQYNAFQLLDLLRCRELTGAAGMEPWLERLAGFVRSGIDRDGAAYYDCHRGRGRVLYHTTAVGAAVHEASRHLAVDHAEAAEAAGAAYRVVLAAQRDDGSLPFSRGDYGLLRDERAYPRNLAMILLHLLVPTVPTAPTEPATPARRPGPVEPSR
jgi:hypothetical protein